MPNPMIRQVNWSITTSTQCVRRLSDSQRNRSMLHKLFECIRTEMRKGSPEGYNAENGYSQPARKPQTGEPYERQPLYRIRCTQEKYQLLREDCRRDHRGSCKRRTWRYESGQRNGGSRGTARWKQRCSADGSTIR